VGRLVPAVGSAAWLPTVELFQLPGGLAVGGAMLVAGDGSVEGIMAGPFDGLALGMFRPRPGGGAGPVRDRYFLKRPRESLGFRKLGWHPNIGTYGRALGIY
jgi:hypothetical protein